MSEEKNIGIKTQEEKQIAIKDVSIASFYKPTIVPHRQVIWCVRTPSSGSDWKNYYAVVHRFGEAQIQVIPSLEGNEDLIFSTPIIFSDDPLIIDFCKKYRKNINLW